MSRSNPTENNPNPAVRRFEWNGEAGTVRYYDREAKKNVDVGTDFTFILLDEVATIGGWDDSSGLKGSAIYSNEVRDTRTDVFVAKSFKGGIMAEGLYKDIKERIASKGGQFVAKLYIAFKHTDGALAIGSLQFKGAALAAWMEFRKACRAELYKGAVKIHGYTEGTKGRVVYRVPQMRIAPLAPESNTVAVALDKELQEWLGSYLSRTKRDQVEQAEDHVHDQREPGMDDDEPDAPAAEHVPAPAAASASIYSRRSDITDADIPF